MSAQRLERPRGVLLEELGAIVGAFDLALGRMRERLVDQRAHPLVAVQLRIMPIEDRREARAPAVGDVPAGIAGRVVEFADRALADRSAAAPAGKQELAGAGQQVESAQDATAWRDSGTMCSAAGSALRTLVSFIRAGGIRQIGRSAGIRLIPSTPRSRSTDRREASPGERPSARANRDAYLCIIGALSASTSREPRSSSTSVIAACGTWTGRGLSSSLIRAAGSELQICNGMPNRNTPEIRSRSRLAVSIRRGPRPSAAARARPGRRSSAARARRSPGRRRARGWRGRRPNARRPPRRSPRSCHRLASCSNVVDPVRGRVDFYVNIPVELVARLVAPSPRVAEAGLGPAADRQQLLLALAAVLHPERLRAGRPHEQVQARRLVVAPACTGALAGEEAARP
jgi:hypothetical protein